MSELSDNAAFSDVSDMLCAVWTIAANKAESNGEMRGWCSNALLLESLSALRDSGNNAIELPPRFHHGHTRNPQLDSFVADTISAIDVVPTDTRPWPKVSQPQTDLVPRYLNMLGANMVARSLPFPITLQLFVARFRNTSWFSVKAKFRVVNLPNAHIKQWQATTSRRWQPLPLSQ